MAHYAFLTEENIVIEVITGRDEDDLIDGVNSWEDYYAKARGLRCLRTSYNTLRNKHHDNGVPFRGNYAGMGHTYDEDLDAFIPPKPTNGEWVLDELTFSWVEVVDETI